MLVESRREGEGSAEGVGHPRARGYVSVSVRAHACGRAEVGASEVAGSRLGARGPAAMSVSEGRRCPAGDRRRRRRRRLPCR